MTHSHFKNQSVEEHLKKARTKGHIASLEPHGVEMSGAYFAGGDAAKEIAIFSTLMIIASPSITLPLLGAALLSLTVWKTARSALLGWSRLEKLNRLMEEERQEILKNRSEEEMELKQLYAAKGFSGQLLDDVVTTLSSNDNRLLEVMLEEELGLSLEKAPHPLQQGLGALCGCLLASIFILTGFYITSTASIAAAGVIIFVTSYMMAKKEGNASLESIVWNLSAALLMTALAYIIQGALS